METASLRRLAPWLLLLTLVLSRPARAQNPGAQLAQLRQQYPSEKAVFLDYRQELTVEVKGDSVQVLARHHYDMLHLGPQSALYAPDQVYSSHFNRLQQIEARTLVPAGSGYKAIKVTEFKDKFDILDKQQHAMLRLGKQKSLMLMASSSSKY